MAQEAGEVNDQCATLGAVMQQLHMEIQHTRTHLAAIFPHLSLATTYGDASMFTNNAIGDNMAYSLELLRLRFEVLLAFFQNCSAPSPAVHEAMPTTADQAVASSIRPCTPLHDRLLPGPAADAICGEEEDNVGFAIDPDDTTGTHTKKENGPEQKRILLTSEHRQPGLLSESEDDSHTFTDGAVTPPFLFAPNPSPNGYINSDSDSDSNIDRKRDRNSGGGEQQTNRSGRGENGVFPMPDGSSGDGNDSSKHITVRYDTKTWPAAIRLNT